MSEARNVLHVAVPETQLAVAYRADMSQYLWDSLLPIKMVYKPFNLIRGINKGNLLRRRELRAGPNAPRVQFKMDANQTYQTTDFMLEVLSDDRERQIADDIVQYDPELIYHLTLAFQTSMEFATINQLLRDTANYGSNYEDLSASGGVRQYDNLGSPDSDPVVDFRKIVTQGRHKLGGKTYNRVVMSEFTWNKIQENNNVQKLGRMQNFNAPFMWIAAFEDAVGVPRGAIRLTAAVYNDSLEDQTDVFKTFIGPDIIFAYVEPPDQRFFGAGLSMMFPGGMMGAGLEGIRAPFSLLSFPDMGHQTVFGGTKLRLAGGIQQKILNTDAMYLLQNAVNKSDSVSYGSLLLDATT